MSVQNPTPPSTPQELARQAVGWARSTNPSDQSSLLSALGSADYLNRLDSADEYLRSPATHLRVARIFKVLLMNDSLVAHQTLTALTQVPTFKNSDSREELLVKALAVVRPAPSVAIKYWDEHSTPDAIHLHFTIDALCKNGSEPAIALLERKLLDPDQEYDFKVIWMRDPILQHRNDQPLLRGCHRLLQSTLEPELKGVLIEALCVYRREEWYRSCTPPKPPPRALASREALLELRACCEYAKDNLKLQPLEIVAVDTTLAELQTLLGN